MDNNSWIIPATESEYRDGISAFIDYRQRLIDGDPETAWCSRGGERAKRQPEWIRIDLPTEATIRSIALVCSEIGPGGNFPEYVRHVNPKPGKALPKEITVKLSRDAFEWEKPCYSRILQLYMSNR